MPVLNVMREKISLNVDDGTRMDAYVSRPESKSGHKPMLVLQEAFGLNPHIRNVADRLAQQGYLAVAPELFHRTAPGIEIAYKDFASAMPHMQAMTTAGAEADLRAAFQWLQAQQGIAQDGVACVGYCMGGRMSFLANTILPLRAAVSYYGGRIAPELITRSASLHGPMLFFWGELDQHIPPEQRAAVIGSLKQSGKTYANVEFSKADHGFFCDERRSYEPHAARQSWALMLEFLQS